MAVRDYLNGTIRKHEETRPDKEDDRTRHIDALSAHDEPVFLTVPRATGDRRRGARGRAAAPEVDFPSTDGVAHTLWVLPRATGQHIAALFGAVPRLYVADGHHRSAAAARVHALRAATPGEHDVFPVVVFPHDQVQILTPTTACPQPGGPLPAHCSRRSAR